MTGGGWVKCTKSNSALTSAFLLIKCITKNWNECWIDRSPKFFPSFEIKSSMENPKLVLKKPYLLKNHHLFSNPPLYTFSRQFWVQTVSETIWSSMSGRQPISKIWENLISVYHPSTRCKNFRGIGWKLWKKGGG